MKINLYIGSYVVDQSNLRTIRRAFSLIFWGTLHPMYSKTCNTMARAGLIRNNNPNCPTHPPGPAAHTHYITASSSIPVLGQDIRLPIEKNTRCCNLFNNFLGQWDSILMLFFDTRHQKPLVMLFLISIEIVLKALLSVLKRTLLLVKWNLSFGQRSINSSPTWSHAQGSSNFFFLHL